MARPKFRERLRANPAARYQPFQLVVSRHDAGSDTLHVGVYVPLAYEVEVKSVFAEYGYLDCAVIWSQSHSDMVWVSHTVTLNDWELNNSLVADLLPYSRITIAPFNS